MPDKVLPNPPRVKRAPASIGEANGHALDEVDRCDEPSANYEDDEFEDDETSRPVTPVTSPSSTTKGEKLRSSKSTSKVSAANGKPTTKPMQHGEVRKVTAPETMSVEDSKRSGAKGRGIATSMRHREIKKLIVPDAAIADDEMRSGKWSMQLWIEAAGVHRVVTAAMHAAMMTREGCEEMDPYDALKFVKGLRGRGDLHELLGLVREALFEGLVDLMSEHVEKLQTNVDDASTGA